MTDLVPGLVIPDHQTVNPCYDAQRAYEAGYDDGRCFSARRRPGATRGRDANYDRGLAMGFLDRLELDGQSDVWWATKS